MSTEKEDREKLRRRFPTERARAAADKAIDMLPIDQPMARYIDVWIAAYKAAGGVDGR